MSPVGFNRPNQPVVRVSWFHAFEYCDSNGLYLPSVDQWEYAARGPGFGLHDMTGNVWEWTARNPSKEYPYGLRGGSWDIDYPGYVPPACRGYYYPEYRYGRVGFRVSC